MTAGQQRMTVPEGAFSGLQLVTMAATPRDATGTSPASDQASDFLSVQFDPSGLTGTQPITFTINYDNSPLHVQSLKRASSIQAGDWESASGSMSGGQATVETTQPGVYAVTSTLNGGAVAGIVIGVVVFFAIVAIIVWKVYSKNAGSTLNTQNAHVKSEVPMAAV
jgi:hypothetical protein